MTSFILAIMTSFAFTAVGHACGADTTTTPMHESKSKITGKNSLLADELRKTESTSDDRWEKVKKRLNRPKAAIEK